MLEKGLRHVPTIVYTVHGECTLPRWFPRTSDERMREAYSGLAKRVKLDVVKDERLEDVPRWARAEWSIAMLRLKEVWDGVKTCFRVIA